MIGNLLIRLCLLASNSGQRVTAITQQYGLGGWSALTYLFYLLCVCVCVCDKKFSCFICRITGYLCEHDIYANKTEIASYIYMYE